jgi:hypothetical protein
MQTTIQLLYKTVSGNKKKERFETILEPLQALIQIALLSYFPIGSKLTIQNNILHIQAPSYRQSVTRWYNNDTQEDLFYLFNIFCRFKKFYIDVKVEHTKLFELLILQAKNGINNLIRTYNQTDKTHVLHTLQMYKNMLDGTTYNYHTMHHHPSSPATNTNMVNVSSLIQLPLLSLSSTNSLNHITASNTSTIQNNTQYTNTNIIDKNKNYKNNAFDKRNKMNSKHENDNISSPLAFDDRNDNEKEFNKDSMHSSSTPVSSAQMSIPTPPMTNATVTATHASTINASSCQPEIDMDTIFIKISELYSDEMFRIIYNAFIEMDRDNTNYLDYSNGLNTILHPINIRIKKWIDENIVF